MSRLARSFTLAAAVLLGLAAPATLAGAGAAVRGDLAADERAVTAPALEPPYPASDLIAGVRFDWSTLRLLARGSDNWPVTWAEDGSLYTAWGDGGGFGPDASRRAYVSLGVARLSGSSAATLEGRNLIGGLEPAVADCFPRLPQAPADGRARSPCFRRGIAGKSRGILALDGALYAWLTPGSTTAGYRWARIVRADTGTNGWTAAAWRLGREGGPPLIFPTFLQAGRNHADLPGAHVYSYAARYAPRDRSSRRLDVQVGPEGGEVYLLRSRRAGPLGPPELNAGGDSWTGVGALARPVHVDRNGVGPRVSAIYVRQLGRYILMAGHGREYASRLGMFEARTPGARGGRCSTARSARRPACRRPPSSTASCPTPSPRTAAASRSSSPASASSTRSRSWTGASS